MHNYNTLDLDVITVGRYVPDATKKTYIYPGNLFGLYNKHMPLKAYGGLVQLFMGDDQKMKGKMVFFSKDEPMSVFRGTRDNLVDSVLFITKRSIYIMDRETAVELEQRDLITC